MSDIIPPPPPARGNDSCWKWGAITCGILGCLGVIAIVGLFWVALRSPIVQQMAASFEKANIVERDMRVLSMAIDKYVQEKKRYPARLEDLVPKYVTDKRHLQPSVDPNGPPFVYTPPPKDAPPSFVILQYDLPSPLPGQHQPPWTIRLRKDGTVEGLEYTYKSRSGSLDGR